MKFKRTTIAIIIALLTGAVLFQTANSTIEIKEFEAFKQTATATIKVTVTAKSK